MRCNTWSPFCPLSEVKNTHIHSPSLKNSFKKDIIYMYAKYSKMPATWCCKLSRKYFISHLWKHFCCAERSLRVQKGNHKGSSFGSCSHRGKKPGCTLRLPGDRFCPTFNNHWRNPGIHCGTKLSQQGGSEVGWIAVLWILRSMERCGSRSQGLPPSSWAMRASSGSVQVEPWLPPCSAAWPH